jgi:hypothetical protein
MSDVALRGKTFEIIERKRSRMGDEPVIRIGVTL